MQARARLAAAFTALILVLPAARAASRAADLPERAQDAGVDEHEAACRALTVPSVGAIPLDLVRRCAAIQSAGAGRAAPQDPAAILVSRGPILAQETSTSPDRIHTTSVAGIATLTPFAEIVSAGFPADVEILPSDPANAYQLASSGAASRVDSAGVTTALPDNPPPAGQSWTDMAVDPTSGIVYASAVACGTASSLSTVDLSSGTSVLVGAITNSTCVIAIAFDHLGNLFGVDIQSDSLLAIDKGSGAGTIRGPIGFDANFGQALDCDPASGSCYLFAFNAVAGQAQLRSVDLLTGATTFLAAIGSAAPGGAVQVAGAVFGTIQFCSQDSDCNLCLGETCVGNACQPGNPVDCNDGLFCTLDGCTPSTGACVHAPYACADTDACTIDSCDETADVCEHVYACTEFCSGGSITIHDGPSPPTVATPYPATIPVSGQSPVSAIEVRLLGLTHTFPDDVDILLVGPAGQAAVLLSDVGGSDDAVNVDLTLSDAAAASVPDSGPLVSGRFKPTNESDVSASDSWPPPASATSGASALSTFTGTNPNGAWNLYVVDDAAQDEGSIAGGWCLRIRGGCSPPAEVDNSLRLTKILPVTGAAVRWNGSGSFSLYRGSRAPLAAWSYNQTCMRADAHGNIVRDLEAPPLGTLFFYLVTRRDDCGESIAGRDGNGAPIPTPVPCRAAGVRWMDDTDSGDQPIHAGCHWEYLDYECASTKYFSDADYCDSTATTLTEWTDTSCHDGIDSVDYNCDVLCRDHGYPGGFCLVVPGACAGHDSAECRCIDLL